MGTLCAASAAPLSGTQESVVPADTLTQHDQTTNFQAALHTQTPSPPLVPPPPPSPPPIDYVADTPLFWTRHMRSASSASYHSLREARPIAIGLEDHSAETHEQAQSCWAKSVSVDEYSVVSGATGIGAYVVWHCTVRTLKGGDLSIRKRYSEFDRLRGDLIKAFPHADAMIPDLPRKSLVSRFRPEFLEHRKNGLSHFLNYILLNPEFASSPILKDFIFS